MRIWLKPDVMAQYHLMPTDVSAALAEQNIEAAPGDVYKRQTLAYPYEELIDLTYQCTNSSDST